MYTVYDFYESQFGEAVYATARREDAQKFCKEYAEQTDGECWLEIREGQSNEE